ncbi:hypothetical protein DFH27DRAFT_609576 [Peziza echinospora]|nr:hypothetical protein DFH27DRAFT_609576 [Peziza echinospora]
MGGSHWHPMWGVTIVVCSFATVVSAGDNGDDFSNNLFSDLAPLLTLFGEQFAKQYLSQSTSWLDSVIFALAPFGILTAIVGAIRVGGPPWLKALIGRARENRATVEMELMSSTSQEVCELWNGEGIVRTMGRPEILQVVYIDELRNEESLGFYTIEEAVQQGHLKLCEPDKGLLFKISNSIPRFTRTKKENPDVERSPIPDPAPGDQDNSTAQKTSPQMRKGKNSCAPNISMNVHTATRKGELYAVADGRPVATYAYPILASGTILLKVGMIICATVVEQATVEKKYVRTHPQNPNEPLPILWVQRSHVVNDQTFDSYVIFSQKNKGEIITSHRTEQQNPSEIQRDSLIGTLFGILGFIMQFQEFRGLNWSASIAQLICVIIMTACRGLIRRGIVEAPLSMNLSEGHELDWLALWIGRRKDKPDGTEKSQGWLWPNSEKDLRQYPALERNNEGNAERFPDSGINQSPSVRLGYAQYVLQVRQRLGTLAQWSGEALDTSSALAESMQIVMDNLFDEVQVVQDPDSNVPDSAPKLENSGPNRLSWFLEIDVGEGKREVLRLQLKSNRNKWVIDVIELDAVMSLWMFCIKNSAGSNEGNIFVQNIQKKLKNNTWVQKDAVILHEATRIVSRTRNRNLDRDLLWWMPSDASNLEQSQKDENKLELLDTIGFVGPVTVIDDEPTDKKSVEEEDGEATYSISLVLGTKHNLAAHHIFSAFLWAISPCLKIGGETVASNRTGYIANPATLRLLRFQNPKLSSVIDKIADTGLGSTRISTYALSKHSVITENFR